MYYCLDKSCVLRGWDKLPTGIVKRMSGQVVIVDPALYGKILNSPWVLFEGSPLLTDQEITVLDNLTEQGMMALSDSPAPLSPEQEYRRHQNRYLHAAHWAITGRCNCRCRHCYMSAPSGNIGEYAIEECLDIIGQMREAGLQEASLTGGEPLLHRDFMRILEELTDAGIRIGTIMSNGLLVDEELLGDLERLNQRPEFNMSFDGVGWHDWLRNTDGAEGAVIRAFRICHEHGFPTGSEYCLHRGNVDVLAESIRLLASVGCTSVKVNGLSDEGEAAGIQEYILSPEEEYQVYLDYLPAFLDDGLPVDLMLSGMFQNQGMRCSIPWAKMPEDKDCGNYCLCGHARNMMHITADGYIVPCIPMGSVECGKTHFPNLGDMTIAEALSDSTYMAFIDTRLTDYFSANPACEACEYRNRCAGGCRGNAAYTGDLMAPDPKACRFFKDGWYEKTRRLVEEYVHRTQGNRTSCDDQES
ncbi:MAG: radical SAM protein [Eggerthellaceae bacterium]|nr:radical SAM protein [Eggerthellaceae bacterium]